jgi:hypothetical protein
MYKKDSQPAWSEESKPQVAANRLDGVAQRERGRPQARQVKEERLGFRAPFFIASIAYRAANLASCSFLALPVCTENLHPDVVVMKSASVTHDDELLWDVVAFVRKLPELTPEQYETLVKSAPKHEELMQDMQMGSGDKQNGKHEHQ